MNVMFAISDAVWQAAIAAAVVLIPAYMNYRSSVKNGEAIEQVAVISKEAKKETDDKLAVLHDLGNSGKGALLRTSAVSARALAISEPTATNKALSDRADADLKDHDASQAAADKTKEKQ